MSCYEWETGTIIIPKDQWSNFRSELIKSWNDSQTSLFDQAVKAHALASEKAKGKRGTNRQNEILSAIAAYCNGKYNDGWFSGSNPELFGDISSLILKWEGTHPNKTATLISPKKSDLQIFPITKSASFNLPDATIRLDNDLHSVTWDVPENNRAREHARNHPLGKKLFKLLNGITWKRGSGGDIIGNDEYNRDADYEGGGANYVTLSFGPATKSKSSNLKLKKTQRSLGILW